MGALWKWVFAPIGFLLAVISLAVTGLTLAGVIETDIFLDEETFEIWIDKTTPQLPITAELRVPSPSGEKELIVAKRDSFAIIGIAAAGEPIDTQGYYSPLVKWDGDPQALPVDVAWRTEEVIRFTYCDPTPLWITLKPKSTIGTVYAEYVREEECQVIDGDSTLSEEPIPVF